MIDLVRELRASALPGTHVGDCMMRAADEIERLRAVIEAKNARIEEYRATESLQTKEPKA